MVECNNTDELIRDLLLKEKLEATKALTEFYAIARFKIDKDDFNRQYTEDQRTRDK